ncbi:hypothetical protein DJ71_05890 [Halorubrum sp. E3]|nr:hypothetical protein DJ71_05890 [Halorubrum sp. E3]
MSPSPSPPSSSDRSAPVRASAAVTARYKPLTSSTAWSSSRRPTGPAAATPPRRRSTTRSAWSSTRSSACDEITTAVADARDEIIAGNIEVPETTSN